MFRDRIWRGIRGKRKKKKEQNLCNIGTTLPCYGTRTNLHRFQAYELRAAVHKKKQSRSRKKAWQAQKEKKNIRGQTAWIHSVCVCVKCVELFAVSHSR